MSDRNDHFIIKDLVLGVEMVFVISLVIKM